MIYVRYVRTKGSDACLHEKVVLTVRIRLIIACLLGKFLGSVPLFRISHVIKHVDVHVCTSETFFRGVWHNSVASPPTVDVCHSPILSIPRYTCMSSLSSAFPECASLSPLHTYSAVLPFSFLQSMGDLPNPARCPLCSVGTAVPCGVLLNQSHMLPPRCLRVFPICVAPQLNSRSIVLPISRPTRVRTELLLCFPRLCT